MTFLENKPMTRDHVSDTNGIELSRLSKLYDFPSFVKSANLQTTCHPQSLAPTVYGDPRTKQFPCHNAAATWLSCLFFAEKKSELHTSNQKAIQTRLDRFVDYWRIKAAVDQMYSRYQDMHKNADSQLPDSDFAYVWVSDTGEKVRHLRLKNAMEVKVAAEWLQTNRDHFTYKDRHTVATKIMEKAAHFGATLGAAEQFIHRQAGHGICNPREVVNMIRERTYLAKSAEVREGLEKLATIVSSKPSAALGPQSLIKLAHTIDMFDRDAGLVGKYTGRIQRPEDVIFKLTLKEAKDCVSEACSTTSGHIYDRSDFERVSLQDVQDLFGDRMVREVSNGFSIDPEKLAEVVSTLPRSDAEMFDQLMKESGILPIQTKSAALASGVDTAAKRNFLTYAAQY